MRQTAKQLNRKKFLEIGIIGLKLNRGFSQLPFLRSIIAVKTTWPFHGRNNLFNLQLFVTKKSTNLFTSKFKQRNCRCSGHNGNKSLPYFTMFISF